MNGVLMKIPRPGGCDEGGCVLFERTGKEQMLFQLVDTNYNGHCNILRTWKSYNSKYYILYDEEPCVTYDSKYIMELH